MGRIGIWELLVIALIAILLFGAGRIADIGRGLGEGIKNFKKGIKDDELAPPKDAEDKPRQGLESRLRFWYKNPRLDGDWLRWQIDSGDYRGDEPFPDLDLLRRFAGLSTAKDAKFLRFARQYGPLWICHHGYAWAHTQGRKRGTGRCYRRAIEEGELREPLAAWRRYASRASAILSIAARLREKLPVPEKAWERLSANPMVGEKRDSWIFRNPVQSARQTVQNAVNEWLYQCEVRPFLWWNDEAPAFDLSSSLLGAIGIQLMSALMRREHFQSCHACGQLYAPKRRPRKGENNYCEECGKKARNRIAQQRLREKKRSSARADAVK